jgi:hypothetical protein
MTSEFPHAVDNSMRKVLVKCEKAAHYKFEMGLATIGESRVDLHAGGAFAKGMEAMRRAYYIDGWEPERALNIGINALHAAYGSYVAPDKSNKTVARMAGALAFYQANQPMQDDPLVPVVFPEGSRGIELSFNYEIGISHPVTFKPLTFCGRFDMLAMDKDGRAWVVDDKTTSQMGEKWANQWFMDSQVTGYCWGARKLLDEHGMQDIPIAGAQINGIAIRLRDYEYQRLPVFREQWEIDRWFAQMKSDVSRWRDAFIDGVHDQALDHACAFYNNPCEFTPLCKSRNPERLIDGSFVVQRWNPLTRSET